MSEANWIKFNSSDGTCCPVDGDTIVEVRLKENTFPIKPLPAKELYWWIDSSLPTAIVEYRIIKMEK